MVTTSASHRIRFACGIATAALFAATATGCQFGVTKSSDSAPADASSQTQEASSDADANGDQEAESTDKDGNSSDAGGDSTSDSSGSSSSGSDEISELDLGDPVKSVQVPALINGDKNATLDVSIYPMKRDGELITAYYSFTLHTTSNDMSSVFSMNNSKGFYPYAIDKKNLMRHALVSTTGGDRAVTNSGDLTLRDGETKYAYAIFAAPPEDVKQMDVFLYDGLPLAEGVPIK